MADTEGVRGVQTNPLLSLNYFIFMGNFKKNRSNCTNRPPPSANLNPRSKNLGSAPAAIFLLIPLNGVNQEKVGKLIPNCIQSQTHWSPFSLHIIYDFKGFHCQGQLYKFMHFHAKSYFALFSCNLSFSILKPKCLVRGKK